MNEELKAIQERIEKVKRNITNYIKIAEKFDFPEKEREIQMDLMFDDLKKLMEERDKLKK